MRYFPPLYRFIFPLFLHQLPQSAIRAVSPSMVKPARNAPPASFEAALAELETIVRSMEASQLPLEESLAAYERGAALLTFCQGALGAAEQKLKMLENGSLREFDQTARSVAPGAD